MSDTSAPLHIAGLTKKYGKFVGVNDINLTLDKGEVFGFLGPNGAGKSTTIRTVLNFIRPSSGTISVFGRDSVRDSVAIKQHIGYLAGDIVLYDDMTGRQLLTYLASIRKSTDWDYVNDLQKRLGATLDRPIKKLSKGNEQKIGLIQAFMHRPDLIILDEPTSGLDPLMKQVFYEMVSEASADGTTFFISSHDLTEVQKICHRAAFIRGGKLMAIENINSAGTTLLLRRYVVRFAATPPKAELMTLPGVSSVETKHDAVMISVTDNVNQFIKALARYDIVDLDSEDMSLEDVFMHYYTEDTHE